MDEFNRKIEEIRKANQVIEQRILSEKKISQSDVLAYINLISDGQASTVGFAVRKLKLIKSIVENQHEFVIEGEPNLTLKNISDFKNWIHVTFDEYILDEVF